MLNLKSLFKSPKGRKWSYTEADLPWFDQPNALDLLEEQRRSSGMADREYEALRSWVEHGYFVLDDVFPMEAIDGMVRDLDAIWTAQDPIPELTLCDLRLAEGAAPRNMSHPELLDVPAEERLVIRQRSHWRVHEFFRFSSHAQAIHDNEEMIRIASLVMGRPTNAEYTINFMYGSRQHLHQDSCVFHLFPPNYLMGAWLACEDIKPESGPLVYYPGSHKEKLYAGFTNYPQTNLKTCDKATTKAYEEYLERTAERYEPHEFLAKKGQVLLWHGMLIHGGAQVADPSQTRNSYVCHYVPPGMKQDQNIVGPFNW